MWSSVADGRRLNLQQLHLMGGPSSSSAMSAAGLVMVACVCEVGGGTVLRCKSIVLVGSASAIGPVLLLMSWLQFDLGDKRCVQSNCGSVELDGRCCHPCFAVGLSLGTDGPR